jgi:galactosylceramidase
MFLASILSFFSPRLRGSARAILFVSPQEGPANLLLRALRPFVPSRLVFCLMICGIVLWTNRALCQAADQTFTLDGTTPGKMFEGVGAVSGGGATSVLLKDYPEPQRSQILDILFKPNFAASMQTLYVEVGGDGNSTQGSEPTHARIRDDENYDRGYEWWLMREAKRRNPALTLDACAWSCPGWIGDGNFWSQDMCDYYVKWIKGLKAHYNLDLDAIGCRNERGSDTSWVKLFRKTLDNNGLNRVRIHGFDNPGNKRMWDWIPQLDSDKELAASIDIVGNHCLTDVPQLQSVRETIERAGKPIWDTEEHVYDEGDRKYPDDFAAALGAVHLFNANFIEQGATKIVNWYLIGSTYPIEPYYQQPPAMFASSPWSGHYALKPIIWSYAHYGQFTKIGWQYVNGGCAKLAGGGTIVSMKSGSGRSEGGDFSVIAETAGAAASQHVTFKLAGGLSSHSMCVWRTTRDSQFARQSDITPDKFGMFACTFEPDAIYSISTTSGQRKGVFTDIPAEAPFPFPYFENFDEYSEPRQFGYLPHYTADIAGVFEIADRPDKAGKCLRQVVDHKSQSWAPEWKPYTILGDAQWTDYEISADIFFDSVGSTGGGCAGVMGRVNSTGNGWEDAPNGYYARLNADGTCAIYKASQQLKSKTHDRQLAGGEISNWKPADWHNLKLRFEGTKITMLVDGAVVITADDSEFPTGLAGLITGGDGDARNSALFDNLLINRVNGGAIPPTHLAQKLDPLYRKW